MLQDTQWTRDERWAATEDRRLQIGSQEIEAGGGRRETERQRQVGGRRAAWDRKQETGDRRHRSRKTGGGEMGDGRQEIRDRR